MNEERILTILQAPHVSEKTGLYDRQYVFKVIKSANKYEIKRAVEKLFSVAVEHVRVVNVKGKSAKFGQVLGRHKDWKKAYVRLESGSEIEIAGSQS